MKNKKDRNTKHKKNGIETLQRALIVCLSVLIVVLMGAICVKLTDRIDANPNTQQESEPTEQMQQESAATVPEGTELLVPEETSVSVYAQLPMLLEDGKLELESLFQYTGVNPDASWQDGTNTGAAVLINRSEEYLSTMKLSVTLSDDTTLEFTLQDLAPGDTIWVYDFNNTQFDSRTEITDVRCECEFREDSGLTDEQVTVNVNGMNVELTNNSPDTLNNLEVRCHSVLEGVFFGGMSFTYTVESLAPGESVTILATDCIFGEAGVTLVDYAN